MILGTKNRRKNGADLQAPTVQVKFDFYQGDLFLDEQTRTIKNNDLQLFFGWTEPGPVGGITVIRVHLCYIGVCGPDHPYWRP